MFPFAGLNGTEQSDDLAEQTSAELEAAQLFGKSNLRVKNEQGTLFYADLQQKKMNSLNPGIWCVGEHNDAWVTGMGHQSGKTQWYIRRRDLSSRLSSLIVRAGLNVDALEQLLESLEAALHKVKRKSTRSGWSLGLCPGSYQALTELFCTHSISVRA